jgi:hypothetical protein
VWREDIIVLENKKESEWSLDQNRKLGWMTFAYLIE